jgi:hypothetical protein
MNYSYLYPYPTLKFGSVKKNSRSALKSNFKKCESGYAFNKHEFITFVIPAH